MYITNKKKHSGRGAKLKIAACERYDAISQVHSRKKHCDKFDDYPHPEFRRRNYRRAGNFERGEFFTIYHFAGPVDYRVTNFIERNVDRLPRHLEIMMGLSKIPLMQQPLPVTQEIITNTSRAPHVDRNTLHWVKTGKKSTEIIKNSGESRCRVEIRKEFRGIRVQETALGFDGQGVGTGSTSLHSMYQIERTSSLRSSKGEFRREFGTSTAALRRCARGHCDSKERIFLST